MTALTSPPLLADSHCHLDFPDFADDLDGVIARAGEAGVGWMLTIGTHVTRFERVLAIAEKYDNVFCTVGIHPHEAANEPEITPERLVGMARPSKVVGFGETGLDYCYRHSPRERQRQSFSNHIAAARAGGLPVIVHTREADADTISILREEYAAGPFSGLIHCFSSGPDLVEKVIELGFYISLSGIVTFNGAGKLRDAVKEIPLDRLLVETDAPYLSPVPKRGKRNEPAYAAFTAATLAGIKGVDPGALTEAVTENFFRLFAKAALCR